MDEELRRLQAAAEFGTQEDKAQFLAARIRAGQVSLERARVAAALGDTVALELFDDKEELLGLGGRGIWVYAVLETIEHFPVLLRWIIQIFREDSRRASDAIFMVRPPSEPPLADRILSPQSNLSLVSLEVYANVLEQDGANAAIDLVPDLRAHIALINPLSYITSDYLVECALEITIVQLYSSIGVYDRYDSDEMEESILPRCMVDNMSESYVPDIQSIARQIAGEYAFDPTTRTTRQRQQLIRLLLREID